MSQHVFKASGRSAAISRRASRLHLWMERARERWRSAKRDRCEAAQLATIPDYLLYDMGLTRDNVPSLARQLRQERAR
jgi:uncharacterized protein YjiS (DUF1127 family)